MARVEISDVVLKATVTAAVPIVGASIQVNVRNGGAATVYAAATGGTTKPNPLTSDPASRIEGWLEEGSYDLVVSGSEITTYTERFEAIAGGSRLKLAPATTGEGTITLPAGDTTVGLRLIRTGAGELLYAGREAFGGSGNVLFRDLHMDTNYQLGFRRGFLRELGDVASLAFGRAGPDGGLPTDTPTSLVGESVVGYTSFLAYSSADTGFWSPTGYNAHIAIAYGRLKGNATATNRGGEYTIGTQNQNATPTLQHRDRVTIEHDGKVHIRVATNADGTAKVAADNLYLDNLPAGGGIKLNDTPLTWEAATRLKIGGELHTSGRIIAGAGTSNQVSVSDTSGFRLGSGEDVTLRRAGVAALWTNSAFIIAKTAAPADSDLAAGEMGLWFDSTNGASKLMIKAKQADGTIRTGQVALA